MDTDEGGTPCLPRGHRADARILLFSSLARADWLRIRVRRRVLCTFPFSRLRAHDYRKRLAAFSTPAERFRGEPDIRSRFAHTGAVMLAGNDLAAFFGDSSAFFALCNETRALVAASCDCILENEGALNLCPEFYRLGLTPAILDLAEDCLGLDCYYLGATLKREKADRRVAGTRQWHMDVEDEKLFRVLVYLAPVTADGGPFEFFARATSQTIKAKLHYHAGYVEDARMAAAASVPPCQCTGNTGDAVIFDGAGVFHRGLAPFAQDRYSITFAYSSRRPLELRQSARLPASLHERFLSTLSARQRATVPPPRLF
ncbi:MAG TPA: hypothetical protein VN723_11455 [Rhizomicrobium sp.]|jgi:hypothetical protein|nr:hypothetical protein [Rhizomicrobium sp.]